MIRKHIFFSGRVQGVGFRYYSVSIARSLRLTGWVRNLSDGRVEMEVQGEECLIVRMMEELEGTPYIRINEREETIIPVLEQEEKFSTRYSC